MYTIRFGDKALAHIRRLKKSGNKVAMIKLRKLIAELKEHPTTGTGKPKQLSGDKTGLWSRRITDKHRLVYEIIDDKVIVLVLTAWGHYDE